MSAAAQMQYEMQETEAIIVWVGRDREGATFLLHPWTQRSLEREFPGAQRWPQVSINRAGAEDFKELSESLQGHVLALLTGLSSDQLAARSDVRFMNPVTDETLAVWHRDRR